jgi:hypothetical protein
MIPFPVFPSLVPLLAQGLNRSLGDQVTGVVLAFRATPVQLSLAGAVVCLEQWVFSPAEALLALLVLVVAETGLGLCRTHALFAVLPTRLVSLAWRLVAYTALLSTAWHLAQAYALVAWLPEAVLIPLALATLLSVVQHLAALGILPHGVATTIRRWILARHPPQDPNP